MAGRLTQKQFADHVGVTRVVVTDLVQRGVVDLSYGLDDSRLKYIARLREQAAGRLGETDSDYDLGAERARLAFHQANKTEMEVAQLKGQLISGELVAATWQSMVAAAKARFLALPTQIANSVIAATDLQAVIDAVSVPIREALSELENDGLPSSVRTVLERNRQDMGAATDADCEPMGGEASPAKRGKRGHARPVAQ